MTNLHVTLRTPTAVLFDGEAAALRLKTDLGRMEVLPDHATLVGTVLYSKVYVRHGDTEEKFIIRQGSVAVDEKGNATVLANEAHKEEELSVENMKDYLEYIVKQMEEGGLNDYQMQFLEERRRALQEGIDESMVK